MNRILNGWTVAALLGGCLAASADVIINVDFQPGGAGGGTSATFAAQGAVSAPGNVWNALAPSTDGSGNGEFGSGGAFDFSGDPMVWSGLLDSEGNATGVSVELFKGAPHFAFALNPLNGGDVNVADDAKELMRDFLTATSPNAVNITGLADGGVYNIFLYGAGDHGGATTLFTINGNSQATTGVPGGAHDLTLGQDYVVFENVVAVGGFIGITYETAGAGDGAFNGMQIALVPEPSTIVLLGVGAALFARQLRRNAE